MRRRKKKPQLVGLLFHILAEAVRFELTNSVTRRQFSRLVPSTTRPRFLQISIIHNSHRMAVDQMRLCFATPSTRHHIYPGIGQLSLNARSKSTAANGLEK